MKSQPISAGLYRVNGVILVRAENASHAACMVLRAMIEQAKRKAA